MSEEKTEPTETTCCEPAECASCEAPAEEPAAESPAKETAAPAEGAETPAVESAKAAEKPSPAPTPQRSPSPQITPRKPAPAGFLVSFVLGVVVGVLAYGLATRSTTSDDSQGPTRVIVKEQATAVPSGEALKKALSDTAAVSSEVIAFLGEKNFGKASKKIEDLSTLFETARDASANDQDRLLMDDLIAGLGQVQKSVNDLAEGSVDQARTLREKIKAGLQERQ